MTTVHVIDLSRSRIPTTHVAVVEHATSRDPGAMYRRMAPAVLGYLRSQGVDDAEDVLGDVFVAVVRDLGRFRGDDDALRRWVFTIAHHRVVDHRRRRGRRPRTESLGQETSERITEIDEPTLADPALLDALATLTPEQRQVIGLRVIADLSVDTVARIVGKRPDAVRALHHRAMTRLAEHLGP